MNFLPYYHNKDQDISASVSFENFANFGYTLYVNMHMTLVTIILNNTMIVLK